MHRHRGQPHTEDCGVIGAVMDAKVKAIRSKNPKAFTPEERITAFRKIVVEGQCARVEGSLIDLFSASVVVKVYGALKPENQAKFSALRAPNMALLAYKLVK